MEFNKIKAFTQTESELGAAITNSNLLELSEDKTKVRRKEPFVPLNPQDVEARTIYIEKLPSTASHEWVKKVFSKFGQVNYVSLPRYQKSRKIKEFAFIEFDSSESVEKAIEEFQKFNGVLSENPIEPDNLLSITTFSQDQEIELKDDDDDPPPMKKVKLENDEEIPKDPKIVEKIELTVSETNIATVEAESLLKKPDSEDVAVDEKTTVQETKKKKRKHKKKSYKINGDLEECMAEMKIMRKQEWRRLRNTYLNLNRHKAKEIKKVLRDNKKYSKTPLKNSPIKPLASPHNFNFYGIAKDVEPETQMARKAPALQFQPGLIVNIKFREPCVEIKEFRKEMKQYSFVKYVDIKEGAMETFVRVDDKASAPELVSQYSSCEYVTEILKDEVEKEYWNKIFKSREEKIGHSKKSEPGAAPVKQLRGREKLLIKINKASEHIRFDDDEENVDM